MKIYEMKRHILFILTLLLFFHAKSQPNCIFTHYSSENGLSQNSIMSMVQDHNGVLWFSTWDGINRFNGYDFKVYKARQGNKITMTNNRVDLLEVDPYNYIWLQTYDYRVYRFDQRTEKFEQIPAEGEEEGMRFSSIKILPDSVIWLLSENEGAVRVKTNPKDYSITTQVYATHSRGGNAVHINQVFSDAYNQEWLLTDNGLLKITNDKEEPVSYFVNIQSGKDEPVQAFYSFCSYGDELYFGSDRGRIWCYSLQNEIFRLWELPVKDKVIAINEIKGTIKEINLLELETKLSGKNDKKNAILEVHSGAGGTESCDWADMLLRMYLRWCDKKNFKYEILDTLPGEEAGVKKVIVLVKGLNAYGYLKCERGVHRLVRLSPFDSQNRRHTSFAAVEVIPEENDDINIEIKDSDIRVDVYRSSGAGGQGVNTTDSAVRITHLPTGIVVTCQNERSQLKNKEQAMVVLKSKLYALEEQKKLEESEEYKKGQSSINFGSQIRSYVMHPYSMVKDHRTNYETSNVSKVLDGDIDEFIESYLNMSKE